MAWLAAMGRLEDRKHYLSDVLFGAALGWSVGLAVTAEHDHSWMPSASLGPGGAALSVRF